MAGRCGISSIGIAVIRLGGLDQPADHFPDDLYAILPSPAFKGVDQLFAGADCRRYNSREELHCLCHRAGPVNSRRIEFHPVAQLDRAPDLNQATERRLACFQDRLFSYSAAGHRRPSLPMMGTFISCASKLRRRETLTATGAIAACDGTGMGRRVVRMVRKFCRVYWPPSAYRHKFAPIKGDRNRPPLQENRLLMTNGAIWGCTGAAGRPAGILLMANRFHGVAKGETGILWCTFEIKRKSRFSRLLIAIPQICLYSTGTLPSKAIGSHGRSCSWTALRTK